jgi:predicted nucleotidyltransferase
MIEAPRAAFDPGMLARIHAELDAIEREQGVRILLAVESGSRAWGFPSRDSDYDVRFIYLRTIGHYLTDTARRDVIEKPIDGDLDLNGWDLRKALGLLVRSNAVLLEWLTSPVRYRDDSVTTERMLRLAGGGANLTPLAYHYHHLARRAFDEICSSGGHVRLKTYCYAVRATLALLWLRTRAEAPPMDLDSLLRGVVLTDRCTATIADLVARKAQSTEQDMTSRSPVLDELIGMALSEGVSRIDVAESDQLGARADELFASIVLGASAPSPAAGG